MTAEEVLNNAGQMYSGLEQMAYQAPAPSAPAPHSDWQMPGDDDIVDGKTFKAALVAVGQPLQQSQQNAQQLAQMSVAMIQQQHIKLFAKYGMELNMEIAKLPLGMRTVDNLRMVVDLVQGRHYEDLANERARELAGNMHLSARSDGLGGTGPGGEILSLESESLPADYRERLQSARVTMETVRSFCRANGMKVEDWFKQASKMAPMGDN